MTNSAVFAYCGLNGLLNGLDTILPVTSASLRRWGHYLVVACA